MSFLFLDTNNLSKYLNFARWPHASTYMVHLNLLLLITGLELLILFFMLDWNVMCINSCVHFQINAA